MRKSQRIKSHEQEKKNNNFFINIANQTAGIVGNPWTFLLAIAIVIIWAICGPFFQFSDTWQLIMNTTSSIVTFLIVFLIQNTQNRDTLMLKIKLDELIRSHHIAKNTTIDLSTLDDEQLHSLEKHYKKISNNKATIPKI